MDTCNKFPGTKENKPIRNKMVANMFQLLTIFVKINIVRTSRMMIETQLLQQAYNLTFKLHKITSILLPYRQHFELYFRTELSTHENKPIRNKMVANMFQLLTIFIKINIVNLF
jgi:hypothetical protein